MLSFRVSILIQIYCWSILKRRYMEHDACLTELSTCCAHKLRCDLDEILTVVRLRDVEHCDGTVFLTAILVTVEMYACRARLVRHLTDSAILIDRLIE